MQLQVTVMESTKYQNTAAAHHPSVLQHKPYANTVSTARPVRHDLGFEGAVVCWLSFRKREVVSAS